MGADIEAPGPRTLADVMPAAAGLLGVEGFARPESPGRATEPEAVTVLLVDGLGWWPWQRHRDLTPTLSSMLARRMSSTVPSTTPTALASLGTGLSPGMHGIVGAAFLLPDEECLLHPLSWRDDDPHPRAVQPEPTVFERVAEAGIPMLSVGPRAYSSSGLTRAVLRGGEYAGADDADEIVDAIAGHRRGLAYAYLPDLDRIGHVHGTESPEWRACLRDVDTMVARILDRIGPSHRLLVTADHGMVDCPAGSRILMEGLPHAGSVMAIAGEPRLRHVYCVESTAPMIQADWSDALGDRASVLSRDQVVASGLMGAMDPHYALRLGDLVVVAQGDTVLASDVDPLVSALVGQHGAVTEVELDIPLLESDGGAGG